LKNIENQILSVIYGHGRGWSFSKKDFAAIAQPGTIDRNLGRLAEKGTIRRLNRGIYDYPKFSKLLGQTLGADMDQVAHALARKYGWNIQVSGNAALNILGLSTQIPTQYLYLSDGVSKTYDIAGQALAFQKTKMTHLDLKYPESALLVQALEALGKEPLSEQQRMAIYQYFQPEGNVSPALRARILKDTQYVTSWIYEAIKSIFAYPSQKASKEPT
jgi:hypothetical protein